MMNENEFYDAYESTLEALQEYIEDNGLAVDYEESNGVLTLELDNESVLIISRQPPVRQLWLAAKAGGFHFDYDAERSGWVLDDGSGQTLSDALSLYATEQAGESISFGDAF